MFNKHQKTKHSFENGEVRGLDLKCVKKHAMSKEKLQKTFQNMGIIDQGLVNIIQIYTTKLWRNEGFLNMFLMTHWDGGLAVFA